MEIVDVSSSDTEDYLSMSEEEEYSHDNTGNVRLEKEVEELTEDREKRKDEGRTAEENKSRRILPSSFLPMIQKEREKNKNNMFHNGSDISLMGHAPKLSFSHGSLEKEVTRENEKRDEEKTTEEHRNRRILPSSFLPSMQKEREKDKNNIFHNGSDVSLMGHVQKRFPPPVRPQTTSNDEDVQILHYHMKSDDSGMNGHGFNGHSLMEHRRHLPSWMSGGSNAKLPPVTSALSSSLPYPKAIDQDERLIFQAALQDLNQPKYEGNVPSDLLTVSLLRHQRIALAWMLKKENSSFCSGGILADDQGLGKTVSIISLIQTEKSKQDKFKSGASDSIRPDALDLDEAENPNPKSEAEHPMPETQESKLSSSSAKSRHSGGTLVVCPASILRQWANEIQEKTPEDKKLSYLIYHGSLRSKDASFLAKHDVVLTTYSIVTNEVQKHNGDNNWENKTVKDFGLSPAFSVPKREQSKDEVKGGKGKRKRDACMDRSGPLARVRWFRVVLDEAQTIKNFRTQVSKACCGLRAKRRWCLSGTPLQNSVDDLYSYFRFLRYEPYADYGSFCSSIKNPISNHPPSGFKKLQAILRTVMLRRTKGTLIDGEPIIKLPPRVINLKKIYFTPEEREFYSSLEADSRKQFKAYADAGTLNQNYASILLLLLRLRQACDHPLLVKEHHASHSARSSLMMARQLPREMLVALLNLLEASLTICSVCSDLPEEPVVTMCGHVFCYQCICGFLNGEVNSCPASGCKDVLAPDSVFSRSTLQRCLAGEFQETSSSGEFSSLSQERDFQSSSKIEAAMEILRSMCEEETPGKAIVFSQWTSMLDFLELSLNQSLIQYRRLDGSMSLVARERAVKDFNTDAEVTVMIMSLKAGNLGLNMVAACHVILLDPWWNPTTEDQAIDRAHRIGQLRTVTVSRLTVSDTVEDRILALQEKKREMVSSAFGEDQTVGRGTRLTVEDLQYLFRV